MSLATIDEDFKEDTGTPCATKSRNKFPTKLLLQIKSIANAKTHQNIITSPFSIVSALSLATCGAKNNTLHQMIDVLYPNTDEKDMNQSEYALKMYLNTTNICSYYNTQYSSHLVIANKLWINQQFKVLQTYMDIMRKCKAVEIETLDCTNKRFAANKINKWCSDQTKGLIPQIVTPNDLMFVRMVITNAIYFKAEFEQAFPLKKTKKGIRFFQTCDRIKEISKVTMMYSLLKHTFCKGAKAYDGLYDVVKIYYKNCNRNLVLVLVRCNDPKDVTMSNFRIEDLQNIKFREGKLHLYVPRFEYECSYVMNDALKLMGMTDAFDVSSADFSNMSKEPVCISKVIHKAYVKVDEKGTEAAAATAVVVKLRKKSRRRKKEEIPMIRFDHIFNFYIMDQQKQIVLFSGCYAGNPK
eukprot:628203_1